MYGQINNLVGVSVFPLRGASWTVLPYIKHFDFDLSRDVTGDTEVIKVSFPSIDRDRDWKINSGCLHL